MIDFFPRVNASLCFFRHQRSLVRCVVVCLIVICWRSDSYRKYCLPWDQQHKRKKSDFFLFPLLQHHKIAVIFIKHRISYLNISVAYLSALRALKNRLIEINLSELNRENIKLYRMKDRPAEKNNCKNKQIKKLIDQRYGI